MHLRPSIPNGNYITPPRPIDVARFVPELARFARSTTRLHPRPAVPAAQQSSIGGPMLWPRAEPWPTCTAPYFHWNLDTLGSEPEYQHLHAAPNSLIPVLQLFASDAPTIRFPDDADLLQLLWCPVIHAHVPGQPDAYAPAITLLWRNSAALSAVAATPAPPVDFEPECIPHPCALHPEVVPEYPLDLPDALWDRIGTIEDAGWGLDLNYADDLSVAPGCKVGGWPKWHAMDPYAIPCPDCGTPRELLICLDTYERGHGARTWSVQDGLGSDIDSDQPTGLVVGRGGDVQIFSCPEDPRHPIHVLVQG